MKKCSLRTKLSSTIAVVVLITVAVISFLSNVLINKQFKSYIAAQQQEKAQDIVTNLTQQYNEFTGEWNIDFLHMIGMYALYDGYIVKIYDAKSSVLWDAETCDMKACMQVMSDISSSMQSKYPKINGEFTSKNFSLESNNEVIGSTNISYFGPYFLSENDFSFLNSLNVILFSIGAISLIISIIVGLLMSKRVSGPILKTVGAARQMSQGDYDTRIDEKTDTRELDELMSSINHLACSLGKQETLRKQLTSDIAHELRTPLTTIGATIEAMIEGVWEPTPERLQSCHDEIGRISKIVRDLENLAKVDSGKLNLNKVPTNLLTLVNKAAGNFETGLRNKNLHLSITGNCDDIIADPDRISQVIMNLISNALKYTNRDGNINISVSESNNTVTLIVQDDGIGIPTDELPFIFERFYRADKSRNRATGGSGIGLAIVKAIVKAHGGKAEVQSVLDHGSDFTITLPKK